MTEFDCEPGQHRWRGLAKQCPQCMSIYLPVDGIMCDDCECSGTPKACVDVWISVRPLDLDWDEEVIEGVIGHNPSAQRKGRA